jgi:peptide/nickel transport system permease protein
MTGFILRRLGFMAITLFVMATVMFLLFRLLPGDPTATVISAALHPDAQAALRASFGLDKPLWQQYLSYVANMAQLDFGFSFQTSRPVAEMVGGRLLNTLVLLLPSLLAAYLVGALIGAFIAWRRGGFFDTVSVVLATALQSAPVFWVGMMAILFFSLNLDLFPVGHIITPGREMAPGSGRLSGCGRSAPPGAAVSGDLLLPAVFPPAADAHQHAEHDRGGTSSIWRA